ncbi:hypothetical protein M8J75_010411 [Diaphorina citri]|nr:hypothetical protein M8J75_010411 [Diaphorina citri]KAI5694084.1 hypothetical protein M8J75_010411 [Diaphorina citri]
MSQSSEAKKKWKCRLCTYENFPSAIRCTMCREERVGTSLNSDIYQLAYAAGPSLCSDEYNQQLSDKNNRNSTTTTPPPSTTKHIISAPHADLTTPIDESDITLSSNQICSSRNKSPSLSPPRRILPVSQSSVTASNIHEHLKPLKISESPAHRSQGNVSPSLEDQSQCLPRKWCCVRCTYENWPKASRCVMCNASPRISPLTASPDLERENASAKCIIDDRNERRSNHRNRSEDPHVLYQTKASPSPLLSQNNYEIERRLRAHRKLQRNADWAWLNACSGIVQGDYGPVHAYLAAGGDPARQLTAPEVALLNRTSAFDVGHTLVHLAIRFQREDILASLLSQIEGSGSSGVKRVPSYVAPDLAADIRRHVAASIRQRKACLPCPFVTEITTFTLPAEIENLPPSIQEQLFDELLDKEAQQQLEAEPHPVINWSHEVTAHLYALWNRSAGDCLLDSLMQATFYPRWKEYEDMHASLLHFSLDESQWEEDWASLVSLASQPGAALEQLHVFALAHILRRPIIVYGVKYVKSFRGEDIGYARFEGVYLPLLWDPSFCSRSPLSLGYTRGHFSALVPIQPYASPSLHRGGGARNISPNENSRRGSPAVQVTFLPLMDHERKMLPIHFVTHNEIGREESLLKQWMDVGVTDTGLLVVQQRLTKPPLLVAQMLEEWLNHYRRLHSNVRGVAQSLQTTTLELQQRLTKPPLLVAQMLEEWLNHYRRLQQMSTAPFSRPIRVQDFSSDESDGDE